MSRFRHDPLEDRWILYVPGRAARPMRTPAETTASGPDPGCPFCPGNEGELAGVISEVPAAGGGWSVRVVPNRYPITAAPDSADFGRAVTGAHEVVIETPEHAHGADALEGERLRDIIRVWRDRHRAHADAAWVVTYKNHGRAGGISIPHPHSQIVAVDDVPPPVAARERRAAELLARDGKTHVAAEIGRAAGPEGRVVARRDGFVAFVPAHAEVPCEVWIAPERPAPDFEGLVDDEIPACAALIGDTLGRLRQVLGDAAYNLMVLSASRTAPPGWHWLIRIRPRLATVAGFELASSLMVNPSTPERDAARLREAGP